MSPKFKVKTYAGACFFIIGCYFARRSAPDLTAFSIDLWGQGAQNPPISLSLYIYIYIYIIYIDLYIYLSFSLYLSLSIYIYIYIYSLPPQEPAGVAKKRRAAIKEQWRNFFDIPQHRPPPCMHVYVLQPS